MRSGEFERCACRIFDPDLKWGTRSVACEGVPLEWASEFWAAHQGAVVSRDSTLWLLTVVCPFKEPWARHLQATDRGLRDPSKNFRIALLWAAALGQAWQKGQRRCRSQTRTAVTLVMFGNSKIPTACQRCIVDEAITAGKPSKHVPAGLKTFDERRRELARRRCPHVHDRLGGRYIVPHPASALADDAVFTLDRRAECTFRDTGYRWSGPRQALTQMGMLAIMVEVCDPRP
jgi:hypothetical protein